MDKETDFPARVPRTPAEFAEVGKVLPSADYERLNKPYQPLPEGTRTPPMTELWGHAMRRYGRYQGYAWLGAIAVGALVYGGSELLVKPEQPVSAAVPQAVQKAEAKR